MSRAPDRSGAAKDLWGAPVPQRRRRCRAARLVVGKSGSGAPAPCLVRLSAAPGGPVDQQEAVGREPPGDRQRQDPSDTANIGSDQRREQVEAGIVGDTNGST